MADIAQSPASAPAVKHPTLRLGSRGAAVQEWQAALGFDATQADGKFGPKTQLATKAFQRSHSLTPDGVVGPKTWMAAYAADPTVPTPIAVVDSTGDLPTAKGPGIPDTANVYAAPPVLPAKTVLRPKRPKTPPRVATGSPESLPVPERSSGSRVARTVRTAEEKTKAAVVRAEEKAEGLPMWAKVLGGVVVVGGGAALVLAPKK
jgi:peptidoglycan hydrolase-like protein with peptidoglycan-binding domain